MALVMAFRRDTGGGKGFTLSTTAAPQGSPTHVVVASCQALETIWIFDPLVGGEPRLS